MKLTLFKLFPCVLNSVESIVIAKINNSRTFFYETKGLFALWKFRSLIIIIIISFSSWFILTAFATEERKELSHDCNGHLKA